MTSEKADIHGVASSEAVKQFNRYSIDSFGIMCLSDNEEDREYGLGKAHACENTTHKELMAKDGGRGKATAMTEEIKLLQPKLTGTESQGTIETFTVLKGKARQASLNKDDNFNDWQSNFKFPVLDQDVSKPIDATRFQGGDVTSDKVKKPSNVRSKDTTDPSDKPLYRCHRRSNHREQTPKVQVAASTSGFPHSIHPPCDGPARLAYGVSRTTSMFPMANVPQVPAPLMAPMTFPTAPTGYEHLNPLQHMYDSIRDSDHLGYQVPTAINLPYHHDKIMVDPTVHSSILIAENRALKAEKKALEIECKYLKLKSQLRDLQAENDAFKRERDSRATH